MLSTALALAREQFQTELQEVDQQLEAAVGELYPPLDYLARGQLTQVRPLVRAALALTAGVGAPDNPKLREQRLMLAAALEMLHIALRIHRLLLVGSINSDGDSNQRSITGSVILTGDYCFTRSAILAAQTDSVEVVAIFSQTLKQISEEILRELFQHNDATAGDSGGNGEGSAFNENRALLHAGIEAAALLAALPTATIESLYAFAGQVAHALATPATAVDAPNIAALASEQQVRWQVLQQWLGHEGIIPSVL